jgi:glycosyltransferase involved in cell wall biosynthesis
MRIAAVTSGAAGMFCGSCLHDNTLAAALTVLGHDAVLVPTYTPIRTDEPDVSTGRVFLGGINVYLNQKYHFARRLPRFVRWVLDRPGLIRLATRLSPLPDYAELGELTLSLLRGEHGKQREEVGRLVDWLAREHRPEIVTLTNVLISGVAGPLKDRLRVPVVAYLQGDDVFLDALRPEHKQAALELIRTNARSIDGFIATCRDYADHMAGYLGIDRGRIDVIYPGLNLKGHGGPRPPRDGAPPAVGYFARIAPEKGFHVLADAFVRLRQRAGAPPSRLRASGWLGPHHRAYLAETRERLNRAGLNGDFEHVESPDLASKVRFLQGCDVLSVPATFREPKGLYVLEALANGTPVVQPASGSFPELVEQTGGGLLVPPNDADALADALDRLLGDAALRQKLGEQGRHAVHDRFSAAVMARHTVEVYQRYLSGS